MIKTKLFVWIRFRNCLKKQLKGQSDKKHVHLRKEKRK